MGRLFSDRVRAETRSRGETLLRRFGAQFVIDAAAWIVAIYCAAVLRYDFDLEFMAYVTLAFVAAGAVACQLLIGLAFSLYRGRHTYGSFEELRSLLFVACLVALALGLPIAIIGNELWLPRSVMFIALPLALVLMSGARYVKRLYVEHRMKPGDSAQPTLIFGAGYMGRSLVQWMLTDRDSPYLPIALLDDNPVNAKRLIRGVPVLGGLRDLPDVADRTGARVVIVAIARVDAALLRTITDIAEPAGVQVKVLPTLNDVVDGRSKLSDVRDIAIEDLIGRQPVETDVAAIASYLTGRRVLVTGAGGSIGSELCRQISKYAPGELIMLDRDETGLQNAQIAISGHGLLDTSDVVLADIRDADALRQIFHRRRPEVVFHAAALKHLPMLEQYPDEAWKTNVIGTLNVLDAASDVNVSTFVNISTDKAANPTSVLGHSKRIAEKLTAGTALNAQGRYLSVRFGNVIGSRGSMLPTFQSLIDAGGPLTVTHPDVTRYFMTIPEACQLVVQAGGIGEPGEVLILDMGEPVRILDIAERMIAFSGKDIEIRFTGLRQGEKLHEDLIGSAESDARPKHPKISHTRIAPLSVGQLDHDLWLRRVREGATDTMGLALGSPQEQRQ
ncbi:polysaccharide biosynthesis protein [Diaminobutyricibacter tongyongensis]|uniref:Polysaccharide biosynthesis protein n=1 Tax=Leifsonia tongyongensis TaxID=1268043 RepID=A0A6L9XW33_9MICO|nr:nucleoside-diphosphate sugar epimerase/dehydratase [Diaminobutyricibacter tongyongensis]NEN05465.1 polysaccharide biosynthesis protein [Diaminobutyricibacter tongyongensis]